MLECVRVKDRVVTVLWRYEELSKCRCEIIMREMTRIRAALDPGDHKELAVAVLRQNVFNPE